MRSLARHFLVLASVVASSTAWAAGDPGYEGNSTPSDPVLQQVAAATSRKDFVTAAAILKEAVARNPGNAEYHNLYAYSIRKGPNPDMDLVFREYDEALRLDPDNRDAHEYVGEAYLQIGDLPRAKEQLAALDKLCLLPCKQYSQLKDAVSQYEKAHAN
jgi:tetratricopeptide (TPR) repeat protein